MYKKTLECVWNITQKAFDWVTMFGKLGSLVYSLSLIKQLIKYDI